MWWCFGSEDPIYANVAIKCAHAVAAKEFDRGIVVCGTGIGVSIAANKVKGAYAACIHDVYQAQRAELSNHANIITMGAQVVGIQLAKMMVKEYLSCTFDENGRSGDKVQRIVDFEKKLATTRSRGINIFMIFQNIAQLKNRYDNDVWQEILR